MSPNDVDVIVMGVAGSGKSTIGRLIAEHLDGTFIDADDLHSSEAKQKMASGIPLTDDDRVPWLDRVAARIAAKPDGERPAVVACSALRRDYRDRLRLGTTRPLSFIHLHGDLDLLELRMTRRRDHFMPMTLLPSQLHTLEPLGPDEHGRTFDIAEEPTALAARAAAWITGEGAKIS